MHFIPDVLIDLRDRVFLPAGKDIRLVGGAVRDWLDGQTPDDFDLATDASPEEQIALYRQHGVQYVPTGLKHGTITVIINHDPFEITSLRVETDHDGRHATVQWTADWQLDLSRRDLTINAIALTLDGVLIDPFGGKDDLADRRVRFVGNAALRMQEDYLRILRWLRFHGRIAGNRPLDNEAVEAAMMAGKGLVGISRERVWSEMSRIIAGPWGPAMVAAIEDMGLSPYIDFPKGIPHSFAHAHQYSIDPVALLVAYFDGRKTTIDQLARNWKWSAEDRSRSLFLANWYDEIIDPYAMIARDGAPQRWVAELIRMRGQPFLAKIIEEWTVPVCPVSGHDLMNMGLPKGPQIGQVLSVIRNTWAEMNYTNDKNALLATVDKGQLLNNAC